jgi:hypothetical protein
MITQQYIVPIFVLLKIYNISNNFMLLIVFLRILKYELKISN